MRFVFAFEHTFTRMYVYVDEREVRERVSPNISFVAITLYFNEKKLYAENYLCWTFCSIPRFYFLQYESHEVHTVTVFPSIFQMK